MSKKRRGKNMDAAIKRPNTPAQSLENSLKEMKKLRRENKKAKSWKSLYKELKKED